MKRLWLERTVFLCLFIISIECYGQELIFASGQFISKPPNQLIGAFGKSVVFDWKIRGTIIERKWKIDGTKIANVNADTDDSEDIDIDKKYKDRISFPTGSSQLTLKNLSFEDEGEYTCDVLDTSGKNYVSSTKLVVYAQPTFGIIPDTTVKTLESQDVSLYCEISSKPAAALTWNFNGKIITNDDVYQFLVMTETSGQLLKLKSTLLVKKATLLNSGDYFCVATHLFGNFNQSTTLEVHSPPVITKFPKENVHTTQSASSVYIECQAKGFPPPIIKWYKYGTVLPGSEKRYHINTITTSGRGVRNGDVKSILTIKDIIKSDYGSYTCEVSNDVLTLGKRVVNNSVFLLVNYGPQFTNIIPTVVADNGTRVSLNCTVRAYPRPKVRWSSFAIIGKRFSSKTSILSSFKDKIAVQSLLTINPVLLGDNGSYICMSHIGNVKKSRNTTVIIRYPPILRVNSTIQNFSLATNEFILRCDADAYPPVREYKWTKDGETIINNESILRVKDVTPSSQGTYRCTPRNILGAGRTVEHRISVLIHPRVTSPASCKPSRGLLYCSCHGVGNPPIKIYWTKAPKDDILSNASSLNVPIGSNATGTYICHLMNDIGYITSSHHVTTLLILQSGIEHWHKDWYILFWVLIPLLVIFILVLLIWASRKQSQATKKAVFVSSMRDTAELPPMIRNIPIHPDVYMPTERSSISAVNSGFAKDDKSRHEKSEVMEVVMYLSEDDSTTTSPAPRTTTDIVDEIENQGEVRKGTTPAHFSYNRSYYASSDISYEVGYLNEGRNDGWSNRPRDSGGSLFDDASTVCI